MTATPVQLSLIDLSPETALLQRQGQPYRTEFLPQLEKYDHFVVGFSGGKDSLAVYLYLRSLGVDPGQIELWHHLVDGKTSTLMDWFCTESYCRAIAQAVGSPIYLSYRIGGIEREMLRSDALTAPVHVETPDGVIVRGGTNGKPVTRLRFPQVGSIKEGRWCSALAKIDVGEMGLRNQPRFHHSRTLFMTGERREESAARSKYVPFEQHTEDARNSKKLGRHIDHWRPCLGWDEVDVWRIIKQFCINPHPCYRLGFGRCSCRFCVFASDNQLATLRLIDPMGFARIAAYEEQFNHTIHRTLTLHQRADRGTPYSPLDPRDVAAAFSTTWNEPIILTPQTWRLPLGAFGENAGPT